MLTLLAVVMHRGGRSRLHCQDYCKSFCYRFPTTSLNAKHTLRRRAKEEVKHAQEKKLASQADNGQKIQGAD
jgi:hypothetical protein